MVATTPSPAPSPRPARLGWPGRVDGGCLVRLAHEGDRAALVALHGGAAGLWPGLRGQPRLLHPHSAAEVAPRALATVATLSDEARELASALGSDHGLEQLARSWNGAFRIQAGRVGHRFDLYADYLASAREFLLVGLAATSAALPPNRHDGSLQRFVEEFAHGVRHGAMRFADRQLYGLTRQMVREGVLTWRDEDGHVVEHPSLRTQEADPANLVSEQAFRREVKWFLACYGERVLGSVVYARFRLHWLEGWTQAAIAEHHGVSQQAVSESLASAAGKLRQAFGTHRWRQR